MLNSNSFQGNSSRNTVDGTRGWPNEQPPLPPRAKSGPWLVLIAHIITSLIGLDSGPSSSALWPSLTTMYVHNCVLGICT